MKRALRSLAAAWMVLSLCAGCTTAPPTQASGTSSAAPATAALEQTPEPLTPITFTMFIGEVGTSNFDDPVAKEIAKRTGVTLQLSYVVSGDEKQPLSLMAASGDYTDLIYPKGSTYIVKNANGILQLDGLIDQYGPDIKAFYGDQIKRLRYSADDPHIYFVGGFAFNDEALVPPDNFELQNAVVKELGYPELKTLQDFEDAIKTYYANHPTYEGQPTIPLTVCGDDWRFGITVGNPAVSAAGVSDDGGWSIDPQTYETTSVLITSEGREYFKWLNHMNSIGLLDPESFLQKVDQYLAKIASGRVLALTDSTWEFQSSAAALKQAGKDDRTYGWYPITLREGIKNASFQSTGYLGGMGVCISAKCKDQERAMKFLDWFCTEDAQILTHWGIEGTDYTIVDGKRVMNPDIVTMQQTDPDFAKKTGITQYCYPFPYYGNMQKDSTGQSFEAFNTIEAVIAQQSPIENEILSHYGVKTWKELYPPSSAFPVKPYGAAWTITVDDTEFNAISDKVTQLGYKMIPAAILAPPDQFDAKMDEYIQACKDAGIDKISAIMRQKIQERAVMWK